MMVIRQLKEQQYERLYHALVKKARAEPLDASYTVDMRINGVEYVVKMQPEDDCKIAVRQALEIERDEDGLNFMLVTGRGLLAAFLEILVEQGIRG